LYERARHRPPDLAVVKQPPSARSTNTPRLLRRVSKLMRSGRVVLDIAADNRVLPAPRAARVAADRRRHQQRSNRHSLSRLSTLRMGESRSYAAPYSRISPVLKLLEPQGLLRTGIAHIDERCSISGAAQPPRGRECTLF